MTENELILAIQEALAKTSEDGATAGEMAEATGRYPTLVRKAIGKLIKEGRMECVKVIRPCIDGTNRTVPGYRMIDKG